ncbi:type 1 fimbrial protein [Xenorhabdus sp. Vera]|uniref:fimbrial protein n=1 Tax=Xenorhabdus koppenhoeferi TaxID=351659 RepID=UPI00199BDBD1|nr:fimbrial protein [Xenorhabdus sp. Vera]MBD2811760.1 type 1 fimbrial protein [Xenorhabdus sp. Vera]
MFISHKKFSLLLAISFVLTGLFTNAYSRTDPCHFESKYVAQNFSINLGQVVLNQGMGIGAIIDSYPVKHIDLNRFHCDRSAKIEWEFTGYPLMMNGNKSIHDSGIAGIGIRVNDQGNETKIEFVKTEASTGSGAINSGVLTARLAGTVIYSFSLNEIHFITPSCVLKEKSILVPMGRIGSAQFSGINSTAGERHFDVDLACNTDTPIKLVLGSLGAGSAENILEITRDNDSAKGIALQVLYKGKPIIFNLPMIPETGVDGMYSVPFIARYIQTENCVTAGKANATATLDIVYP